MQGDPQRTNSARWVVRFCAPLLRCTHLRTVRRCRTSCAPPPVCRTHAAPHVDDGSVLTLQTMTLRTGTATSNTRWTRYTLTQESPFICCKTTRCNLSFQTLEMSCLWWTGLCQNIFEEIPNEKSILPTLSENFNEIKQTWHQLKPQTWSKVNL